MVQIKRKVTIKKKTEQVEEPVVKKPVVTEETPKTPTEPAPSDSTTSSNKGKWIGAAIAALLIAGCAYYFSTNNSGKEEIPQEQVSNETRQAEETNAADSTAKAEAYEEEQNTSETNDVATGSDESQVENNEPQKQEVKKQSSTVNEPVKATSADASVSSSTEENAKRVIRGEFGNGQTRKNRLSDKYTEIQKRVNEMYRNGLVK